MILDKPGTIHMAGAADDLLLHTAKLSHKYTLR